MASRSPRTTLSSAWAWASATSRIAGAPASTCTRRMWVTSAAPSWSRRASATRSARSNPSPHRSRAGTRHRRGARPSLWRSLPALLEELRDQTRPARLVARTDAGAVVAVEVLMKRQVISEVGIGLQLLFGSEDCTAPALVPQEQRGEPPGQLRRHLRQREQLS